MNANLFSPSSWSMPFSFSSPIGPAGWALMAGIPAGILALYFLKLRRRPVQVPSTLLWRRSLEDMHVNSLFQRLRRNLLLMLQLLVALLAIFALAGPRVKGTTGQGQRYILAIDNSASMSAVDVKPNRLAQAKDQARAMVDQMNADDLAMILTFNDRAQVAASYTGNKALLRERIEQIRPSQSTTSLRDALTVAAGLANPSSDRAARDLGTDSFTTAQAGESAKLVIFTDGGFDDVTNFSLGNLEPELIIVGEASPSAEPETDESKAKDDGPRPLVPTNNLAILALQTARNEEKPDQFQVFGRVHNYRGEAVEITARLLRHDLEKPGDAGTLVDAIELKVNPQADQSFKFELPDPGRELLEVRLDDEDDLPLDNRAYTTVGIPRKAQILFVSQGDKYLAGTLKTPAAAQLADVLEITPDDAKTAEFVRQADSGRFDMVIYDRFRPEHAPAANALYFGVLPPGPAYANSKTVEGPVILDWDIAHPLMQYIRDLRLVRILHATIAEPPFGSTNLIESDQGPLAFIAPREGFSDAVIAFGLFHTPEGKEAELNTDWPLRFYSFPLFIFNGLRVLGNARESGGEDVHLPGQPVVIRADSLQEKIRVIAPDGKAQELARSPQGTFLYNNADQVGLYRAEWGEDAGTDFAVNLFNDRESNLAARNAAQAVQIGNIAVTDIRRRAPALKELWWYAALAALGVVLFEWYVYNRRIYL